MFGLLKVFYITPYQRGLLFYRSHFSQVLLPGLHYRWGWHWNVKTFDLNQPRPDIENLEFWLRSNREELERHLVIVRTAFNEAALVNIDQYWCAVGHNQLAVFWRGPAEVIVHRFNLDDSLELPAVFVDRLRRLSGFAKTLRLVHVPEFQVGMLYEQGNFVRMLEPGDYGFWTLDRTITVTLYDRTQPDPQFPNENVLIEHHPDFVQAYCEVIALSAQQVAIVRHHGKVVAILPPSSRRLFWKGVEVELIDLATEAKLPPRLVAELVSGLPEVLDLVMKYLHIVEVPANHLGLLYLDAAFQETLPPGWHVWWVFGRTIKTEVIDLRLRTLEVSGQEILSRDKVPLRLNLTTGFYIADPVKAKTSLADIDGFLYRELQFALRAAVGTRTLDELLEDKGAIDRSVAEYMLPKADEHGIVIESVGVKDIILPGDMKAILCQVVEAEKSAQANVIRRREETAATRSMLNTAKVMENNPIALRLKELEVLERIADKIERITINGSLDSLLSEMIRIQSQVNGQVIKSTDVE
ncbi:MAG: slipin family protein [Cyanobacteria bacterium]|nr:slipin family protein [Cyanobacteriota bacterium]MDW8200947.1 slipin family protein [Cyanobacteriota bacterium SKYGB_h_bin112]